MGDVPSLAEGTTETGADNAEAAIAVSINQINLVIKQQIATHYEMAPRRFRGESAV
jgi:peptidoglycan biosynthesis protein MviN/MurJ (putative lipid II flippase)